MTFAMVFPGQGSQSVGMMADLAQASSRVRETFEEAGDALHQDLWSLVCEGPEDELRLTATTQPTMLAAGVATWRVWREAGGALPARMAGHSLGEYTALVCAGVLDFAQALKLVRCRGEFMQEAVPVGVGAMAAVLGLPAAQVQTLCTEAAHREILSVANFNAPTQTVIAGHAGAVDRAIELARQAGAKRAVRLPVSAPFHCPLMQPAAVRLKPLIDAQEMAAAEVEVVNNVDVAVQREPDAIRDALYRQVASPVRWVELIESMVVADIRTVIECGPGRVLTGINKRIDRMLELPAIDSAESLEQALAAVA